MTFEVLGEDLNILRNCNDFEKGNNSRVWYSLGHHLGLSKLQQCTNADLVEEEAEVQAQQRRAYKQDIIENRKELGLFYTYGAQSFLSRKGIGYR